MKTYIQQFGKQRTGTNYLKALLARNFTDIVLFDNRLGSKHKPFQPVAEWIRERGIDRLEAFHELLRSDSYWRKRNRATTDPFEWVHQPVTYQELLGLSGGACPLHYLISIKNPYAFAVSANRWFRPGFRNFTEPPRAEFLDPLVIVPQCHEFNAAYASYLPLLESGRGLLVRYEELLTDACGILRRIQESFRLGAPASFEDVCQTVTPGSGVSQSPFYRLFYLEKQYMKALSSELLDLIDAAIDWDLMRRYGYSSVERISRR